MRARTVRVVSHSGGGGGAVRVIACSVKLNDLDFFCFHRAG